MAVRSGFVARSMIRSFGPLAVSFGFGGLDGELIFPPEQEPLIEGVGNDVLVAAVLADSPKTVVFVTRQTLDTCPQLLRPFDPAKADPSMRLLIEKEAVEPAPKPAIRGRAKKIVGPKTTVKATRKKKRAEREPPRPDAPNELKSTVKVVTTKKRRSSKKKS